MREMADGMFGGGSMECAPKVLGRIIVVKKPSSLLAYSTPYGRTVLLYCCTGIAVLYGVPVQHVQGPGTSSSEVSTVQ
jgi:hypothetical protein